MNFKKRFRYLNKYVGTYRVQAVLDNVTNDFPRDDSGVIDDDFEDLYIPCRRGKIVHTYEEDYELAILFEDKIGTAHNVYNDIKNKYPKLDINLVEYGVDAYIYFKDSDIKKIATIVYPKTSGASIKPFSNRNLPKVEYTIPQSDLDSLYELVDGMDKVDKMQFFRRCNAEFIDSINHKEKLKESRLSAKEYIHSIGKWKKYLKYVELARK